MTCQHCGMDIPDTGYVCPYCHKKTKGIRWTGWIILFIAALIVLGGIGQIMADLV